MKGASIVVALVLATAVAAQEATPTASDHALREKWQAEYQAIAQSFQMRVGETKLTLHDKPILFYTSPVRINDQHGSMFLWTDEGRPAVIGSVWSAENRTNRSLRNITHELHSLSERPDVRAVRNRETIWDAGGPGIDWLPIAEAPAASRTARLVQMRAIARRFVATLNADEPTELRLMTQPVFRYAEQAKGATDGAIFAYVLGTDPEMFLLVEAHDEAKPAYRAAFARFGNLAMCVKDGEREIWSCERGTPGRSEGKYYLHWRAEQRKADLSP